MRWVLIGFVASSLRCGSGEAPPSTPREAAPTASATATVAEARASGSAPITAPAETAGPASSAAASAAVEAPPTSASSSAPAGEPPGEAADPAKADAVVKAALPRAISLLEHGQDDVLIDEFVFPDDLTKVLRQTPRAELVATFRRDKHARLLAMLREVVPLPPARVVIDAGRTGVIYTVHGGDKIVFEIDRGRVFLRN